MGKRGSDLVQNNEKCWADLGKNANREMCRIFNRQLLMSITEMRYFSEKFMQKGTL